MTANHKNDIIEDGYDLAFRNLVGMDFALGFGYVRANTLLSVILIKIVNKGC